MAQISTKIDEISTDIFRLSTYIPEYDQVL
jgi:hypothetical protein